ncbi:MAG TPA: transglycosylase SLT domain-containing protein [Pyrinomonadaceae bacterium]|nr:transglycosylase SLT domain-containing protein [Pyrinomonadaceae bacterium]
MITFLAFLFFLATLNTSCGGGAPTSKLDLTPPTAAPSSPEAIDPALVEQGASDEALAAVRRLDQGGAANNNQLPQLTPTEHMRRAGIYLANRAFADARRHWQALIERYPNDGAVSAALFSTGRSYFQERKYEEALVVFRQLADRETQSKEGRDGFYYVAPTLLRLGRPLEAAARYREYIERFPQGERAEDAHLNTIDSLREGGANAEAIEWVARTRQKYADTPTATNALFARLRLDVAVGDFAQAVATSDELRRQTFGRGISTNANEVAYLRAAGLEGAGRVEEAAQGYQGLADALNSYYGRLATERLATLAKNRQPLGAVVSARQNRARQEASAAANQYPIPHREIIVRAAQAGGIDPRLVLAIMRQESGFNSRAKSPAAARGLLQLTFDAATKYAPAAQIKNLSEDDLYEPEVNIKLACAYLSELTRMFPNLPEAVVASYNGGEDNVARWVKRARPGDAGFFAAEVGFAETKDYVFKVMANYRAYQQLYSVDLRPARQNDGRAAAPKTKSGTGR